MMTTIDAWYLMFFALGMVCAWAIVSGFRS